MLRRVESEAEKPLSEGEASRESTGGNPVPVRKKGGRPSNAAKVAAHAAKLAAGEITQQQLDAALPPKLAKMAKEVAKVTAEEFQVMLRGEYETLIQIVIARAKNEVKNLKGFQAFLALGVMHDKLISAGPSAGITHQTNIQINGVTGDTAAAIAGKFATKQVSGSSQVKHDKFSHDVTFPISQQPLPSPIELSA